MSGSSTSRSSETEIPSRVTRCRPLQGSDFRMSSTADKKLDVLGIGGRPAGKVAALRAGDLGAKTALVTRDEFGGMAANDGPVPVRTLAHAARLLRDARQLGRYGIAVSEPVLDYPRLLKRVGDVVSEVRDHLALREQIESSGVT